MFANYGVDLLANAWKGFNAAIFAYGQTGAGKSFSMTGNEEMPGLTMRLQRGLFYLIRSHGTGFQFNVECSYFEIYNETVNDLLNPTEEGKKLRVREHPDLGPYVENLKNVATMSFEDMDLLMTQGLSARQVQSTGMNAESSRSHSIFQIRINKVDTTQGEGVAFGKESKISLIDLAGSERAGSAGAAALQSAGKFINQSLTALGKCIAALVKAQNSGKEAHIPFRESVLTWLLREVLWGNSKSSMLAAISPVSSRI